MLLYLSYFIQLNQFSHSIPFFLISGIFCCNCFNQFYLPELVQILVNFHFSFCCLRLFISCSFRSNRNKQMLITFLLVGHVVLKKLYICTSKQ